LKKGKGGAGVVRVVWLVVQFLIFWVVVGKRTKERFGLFLESLKFPP
jgi:hypothetical protein